jgi:hypothetical protein
VVEVLGGEQVAMIGDGDRWHAPPGCLADHFLNVTSAVEKTVVSVEVEMNETRCSHARSL